MDIQERKHIQGADLIRTNLQVSNLKEANLQGANLFGIDLQEADLEKAKLTGTIFQMANLSGANL